MACKRPLVERLPLELWCYIIFLLPPADVCVVRHVSRMLGVLCNDPRVWKHLELESSTQWDLKQIRPIVAQHSIPHIRSISVHNVRDEVVRYILNACPQLEELTVSRWTTLSHHALKCNYAAHGLKRLHLHGQDAAYTAIDALAIARLFTCCPQLQVFEMVAQAHVHLPTLLAAFARHPPQALRLLALPTYHPDPSIHAECFLRLCPGLESVLLISNSVSHHPPNLFIYRRSLSRTGMDYSSVAGIRKSMFSIMRQGNPP
ncbi:hypothetical protein BX666DRAFT_2025530 [Dichotomocladium elegans]|nr:hypothetical protein BX666DRAFT_2025530 [Dichotomocladium elegans]